MNCSRLFNLLFLSPVSEPLGGVSLAQLLQHLPDRQKHAKARFYLGISNSIAFSHELMETLIPKTPQKFNPEFASCIPSECSAKPKSSSRYFDAPSEAVDSSKILSISCKALCSHLSATECDLSKTCHRKGLRNTKCDRKPCSFLCMALTGLTAESNTGSVCEDQSTSIEEKINCRDGHPSAFRAFASHHEEQTPLRHEHSSGRPQDVATGTNTLRGLLEHSNNHNPC